MNGITIVEEHLCRVIDFGELIGYGILVTLIVCAALFFLQIHV